MKTTEYLDKLIKARMQMLEEHYYNNVGTREVLFEKYNKNINVWAFKQEDGLIVYGKQ